MDMITRAGAGPLRRLVVLVLGVLGCVQSADDVPGGARFETYAYADRLLGLDLTREIGAWT